jgi:hypothetical protein
MPTGVFIDGNVWNFLFDRRLDLAAELPAAEWGIMHTREAEFEIPVGKPELDAFITATMERCNVQTDSPDEPRKPSSVSVVSTSAAGRILTRSHSSQASGHRRLSGPLGSRNTRPTSALPRGRSTR